MNMKDANDLLRAGRIKDICTAVYEARSWRPGGIVAGEDLWEAMMSAGKAGRPFPYACLTKATNGLLDGQLITWVSGTGMGKSTLVRELGYADLIQGIPVGDIRLEEGVGKTALNYVRLHLNKRLPNGVTDASAEDLDRAFKATVGRGNFWTFDHFGSLDDNDLLSRMHYLAAGCGVRTMILDHISIVVSGMDESGDERRTIDRLMTSLRSLVERTGIVLHAICHLRRVSNGSKSHEEGGRITLADLRGSQSIAQLSDVVVALERNQQADDPTDKNVAAVRILKCRETGFTGVCGHVKFDEETGRMVEVEKEEKGFADSTDY